MTAAFAEKSFLHFAAVFQIYNVGIRALNRHALKTLFSASSGVFLLAIRKYCCVEETPDFWKTKAFRVLATLVLIL